MENIIDIDEELFDNNDERLMLRGDNVLHDSDKRVIGAIVIYYLTGESNNENKEYGNAIRRKMKKILNRLINSSDSDKNAINNIKNDIVNTDATNAAVNNNAVNNNAVNTTSNNTSNTVSNTVSNNTSNTTSNTASNNTSNNTSNTISNTTSNTASNTTSNTTATPNNQSSISIHSILSNNNFSNKAHKQVSKQNTDTNITEDLCVRFFNELKNEFNCKTNEKLIAYILLACKPPSDDLTIRMTHVYARVQPLKNRDDWLNNFSINAYLDVLTLIVFKEFDNDDNWSVDRNTAAPPNDNIDLDWKMCKHKIVGSLREFMIRNDLIPGVSVNKLLERLGSNSTIENMTDKDVCDVSQMIFVCNSIGAHGCDCFFLDMTPTIEEIHKFTKRYPSSTVFGVMNTQTYKSRSGGEHWVYLGFHDGKADLICSEGSDFSVFRDGGILRREITKYFGIDYSMRKIQHDSFNCAFYSVLSAYSMLIHNNVIKNAVEHIGDDATKLLLGKSIKDIRERLINTVNNNHLF